LKHAYVGVETDFCVLSTVLDAVDAGYFVVVVTDAVGTSQPHSGQAVLDYIFLRFDHFVAYMTTSKVVKKLMSQNQPPPPSSPLLSPPSPSPASSTCNLAQCQDVLSKIKSIAKSKAMFEVVGKEQSYGRRQDESNFMT